MTTCDFDVAVRVVAPDGVTVLHDFNDRAAGYTVEVVQQPDDQTSKTRVEADHVDGDYDIEEHDTAGDLVVMVRVQGSTWAQCATRWQTARAAYRANARYFVDVVTEGVTTRYATGRPDAVQPSQLEATGLLLKRQTYTIRWHVQPNPTITVA